MQTALESHGWRPGFGPPPPCRFRAGRTYLSIHSCHENWTIARRIIVVGASIIVLLIVVAVTAVVSLRQITKEAVSIKENSIPGLSESSTMNIVLAEGVICAILAGEAPNNEERETFLKQLDDLTAPATWRSMPMPSGSSIRRTGRISAS